MSEIHSENVINLFKKNTKERLAEVHVQFINLQKETKINLLQNDFSIAHKISKFADAYSPKYNLVIEVLEQRHFVGGKLTDYDNERELIISSRLGCMIYYIIEQKFLSNSEEEIQRFKNFLTVLDENK